MKTTLAITVFNEEQTILKLLESIATQTQLPDEVIIVDGGSTDTTVSIISNFQFPNSKKQVKIVIKQGNRAVGRNEAIRLAKGEVIAITDAGCTLDKKWLEEIAKPFADSHISVVSGYYAGRPGNVLEACLVPYVLVMPDKVNPSNFLPSTRSMAMKKSVWEKMGGFPEEFRWNEDFVFSKRLEKANIPIAFAPKAIVYWFPRKTVKEGWKMFYAFAKGDAQAGIWRPKVLLLLLRVGLGLVMVTVAWWLESLVIVELLGIVGGMYLFWAIWKNYRYVKNPLACIFLPLWQVVSDSAVFWGTIIGFCNRLTKIG